MKKKTITVLDEIQRVSGKDVKLAIGLMSGTSLDGIDASVVEIQGAGERIKVRELAGLFVPYERKVRDRLLALAEPGTASVQLLSEANFLLGELFARTSVDAAEKAGIRLSEIDVIGSHGQTVYHAPGKGRGEESRGEGKHGSSLSSTLQIGEPCVIAERTGILTVADFRTRDVAAGGQGAPLVPYVDYLLFRSPEISRVLLNIGGIANVTILTANGGLDDVVAFDTGPGNMVIDGVVSILTDSKETFDRDGRMAGKGKVIEELLNDCLSEPFFKADPPKSSGREMFGLHYAGSFVERARKTVEDINAAVRTATAITAVSIGRAFSDFIVPHGRIDEVIVSGGGSRNVTLMGMLEESVSPARLRRLEEFGFSGDSKEALAFAVLASETVSGNAGNIPGATGAAHGVILGKIIPGGRR
ncbi:MAG: anhydro-N-acetylmuramic acid kinase [Candidatus Eisenbacteria bacterium]|nr:anhydro-N-acetylmuramic acid kinase [Candidatus Eisenbacteria bacterium]